MTTATNTPTVEYASWLPHDITYNASFEDALATLVLDTHASRAPGLRVIPSSSRAKASARTADAIDPSTTILESSIDPSTLPQLSEADLPLPPSDPRRVYASAWPGLLLTHPGGFLQGGPGVDPEEDEFARHFVTEHRVRSAKDLATAKAREVAHWLGVARERANARRQAVEKRERILGEVAALKEEREMASRALGRIRERAREKRERREGRRKG